MWIYALEGQYSSDDPSNWANFGLYENLEHAEIDKLALENGHGAAVQYRIVQKPIYRAAIWEAKQPLAKLGKPEPAFRLRFTQSRKRFPD